MQRATELLRPVGAPQWAMAVSLAAALGGLVVAATAAGRPSLAGQLGLGFVLVAVPSLPTALRPAMTIIAVRATVVCIAAAAVIAVGDRPVVLAGVTVAAAMVGACFERIGATAGLAVVLIAADPDPLSAWEFGAYIAGALVVAVAWLLWWVTGRTVAATDPDRPDARPRVTRRPHALRVGLAVGLAFGVLLTLPAGLPGVHWLVTSVLLTIQPVSSDTGVRMTQRLSGNTVGAGIAAAILGSHPPAAVLIAVTVVLFMLAMALRPVNYTWWAITGPPVLMVVAEYPMVFPWYEGGLRLAMNLAGAVIVAAVVFGIPALARIGSPKSSRLDSVYKTLG